MSRSDEPEAPATLRSLVRAFARPDPRKALWQLANTLPPFVALWTLAVLLLEWSGGWSLLLLLPVAGLYVRLFIIQHDCGHGSFFASARLNRADGRACSACSRSSRTRTGARRTRSTTPPPATSTGAASATSRR